MHALIIEDEFLTALSIQTALEGLGFNSFDIEATETGAIEAAERRRPDFITADIRLQDGNGMAAVDAIHAALGPTPFVYITASPAMLEPVPVASVVTKPFTAEAVRRAWEAVSDGPQ